MKFINLTPHLINIQKTDGTMLEVPPSGDVARVAQESHRTYTTGEGIDIYATSYGEVTMAGASYGEVSGLPVVSDNWLIVSAMVRLACPKRGDLVSPGEPIRNEAGQVIGCRGLNGNL